MLRMLTDNIDEELEKLREEHNKRWVPIREVLDIVSRSNWSWIQNTPCKYIQLTLDTRDGKCSMRDRNGEELTLERLSRQEGGEPKEGITYTRKGAWID